MSSEPETPSGHRFELLDELRRAERAAASSRVAATIGHLVATPLNVISGRAAIIRASACSDSVAENARRIEEQVARVAQRMQLVIEYLTATDPAPNPAPIARVLDEAVSLCQPFASERGVSIAVASQSLPSVRLDAHSTRIVLGSLLSMAVRSSVARDRLELSVVPGTARALGIELSVPSMKPPKTRFSELQPPDSDERHDTERLQTLWTCFAILHRIGGSLEVVASDTGNAIVRLRCPTFDSD